MPLSGTLDIAPLVASLPRVTRYATEPWSSEGVGMLHLTFEINTSGDDARVLELLPKALHPTIPPIVFFSIATYPESPFGPFTLAQVRAGCRASALPRGFLLRAYSDSAAACDALAGSWGFDCHPGDVRVRRFHDRIEASVTRDGTEILRASLLDPEPISGSDVQYVATMNLALSPPSEGSVGGADGVKPVLVQVDPAYTFHRAERGRPQIATFDRAAWRADGIDPSWPVAATFTQCESGMPAVRYVIDPAQPAIVGTRRL